MKYRTKQYAATLLAALEGKKPEERRRVIERFLTVLRRDRAMSHLPMILREAEKFYLEEKNLRKVVIEIAGEMSAAGLKKEIEEALGSKIAVEETENLELGAGVRIIVDDEYLVDASARRQVERMFER